MGARAAAETEVGEVPVVADREAGVEAAVAESLAAHS